MGAEEVFRAFFKVCVWVNITNSTRVVTQISNSDLLFITPSEHASLQYLLFLRGCSCRYCPDLMLLNFGKHTRTKVSMWYSRKLSFLKYTIRYSYTDFFVALFAFVCSWRSRCVNCISDCHFYSPPSITTFYNYCSDVCLLSHQLPFSFCVLTVSYDQLVKF